MRGPSRSTTGRGALGQRSQSQRHPSPTRRWTRMRMLTSQMNGSMEGLQALPRCSLPRVRPAQIGQSLDDTCIFRFPLPLAM